MLSGLLKNRLRAFGRAWNYDTQYMVDIVDRAGPGAVLPLNALGKLKYRKDVPLDVYFAANITAGIAADCGPCAQLVVTMAERAGVDRAVLRAIAAGDRDALPEEVRLGVDLARATVARDPAVAAIGDEIVRRWGYRALVSLAYGIVAAQAYPAFKYAIGHGLACSRVRVGGETVATARPVLA